MSLKNYWVARIPIERERRARRIEDILVEVRKRIDEMKQEPARMMVYGMPLVYAPRKNLVLINASDADKEGEPITVTLSTVKAK